MKTYIFLFLNIFFQHCNAQQQKFSGMENLKNRKPVVAGRFYSADSVSLRNELKTYFLSAAPQKSKNTFAIISPHAGYIFSGQIAADAFNQIDSEKNFETIFIIGSSHTSRFSGASIYASGNFLTPIGEVKVDVALAKKLISENSIFNSDTTPHLEEHSLEVQLPFLQYFLKKDFKIIPIILGENRPETSKKIAEALKPYFHSKNLFVISSDFSHYPNYSEANKVDNLTAESILTLSPNKFIETLKCNDTLKIKQLATSACGWSAILTLLYLCDENSNIEPLLINYKNSGDTKFGEKNRVVGYCAISFGLKNVENSTEFSLTDKEKKILLKIARSTIENFVKNGKIAEIDTTEFSNSLKIPCGAFVTLRKNKKLRGCIGRFNPTEPLYKVVQRMAISSATEDYRFQKVSPDEIKDLHIEISVLTPMEKIATIDEIVLGKHGIYIKKGNNAGTFLPQVATETGWNKEEFLGHCSQDKAGIGWSGWKNAEIFIYEALVFEEE